MARPTSLDYGKFTKELIEDLYIDQNLSRGGLCKKLGLPESSVRAILHHWGIRKSLELQTECRKKGVEAKSKMGWYRESSIKKWQDPEFRKKTVARVREASQTPEHRKRLSEVLRGKTHSESWKRKMREHWEKGTFDFFKSEEFWEDKRQIYSDRTKQQWTEMTEGQKRAMQKKRQETLIKKGTLKKSKLEQQFWDRCVKIFPDLKWQYMSEEYPFSCDFYIPSKDLYIELNMHWGHGDRPYTGSKADKKILAKWKSKATKSIYYKHAMHIWTESDVLKRKTAKENDLNFLEFYTWDECEHFLREAERGLVV